jgi:hypothetical protein
MFSNSYWLGLHNKTRVALAKSTMKHMQKPEWNPYLTLLVIGFLDFCGLKGPKYLKYLIVDTSTFQCNYVENWVIITWLHWTFHWVCPLKSKCHIELIGLCDLSWSKCHVTSLSSCHLVITKTLSVDCWWIAWATLNKIFSVAFKQKCVNIKLWDTLSYWPFRLSAWISLDVHQVTTRVHARNMGE